MAVHLDCLLRATTGRRRMLYRVHHRVEHPGQWPNALLYHRTFRRRAFPESCVNGCFAIFARR